MLLVLPEMPLGLLEVLAKLLELCLGLLGGTGVPGGAAKASGELLGLLEVRLGLLEVLQALLEVTPW